MGKAAVKSVAPADGRVTSAPDLSIGKSVSRSTARPGDTLVYTLTYGNSGTDTATGVEVSDLLPADVTFVSAQPTPARNGDTLTWSVGDVAAGASRQLTVTVTVDSPLANGTVLYNTAAIDSDQTSITSTPPDAAKVTVASAPKLGLDLTPSVKKIVAGRQLVYTLDYRNTGTDRATGSLLSLDLPTGVTLVSASNGGSPAGQNVSWNLGSLSAGDSGTVSVTVRVNVPIPDNTVLQASASLIATGTPAATARADVRVSSGPVLSIDKSASRTTVNAGQQLVYTLEARNTGTDNATNVIIEDTLPPEVSFVSASAGGSHANGVVTWNLGTKSPGTQGAVTVTVRVNSPLPNGTVLHNSATLRSDQTQPLATPVVDVTVSSAPQLTLDKQATRAAVNAGGTLSYVLKYENNGSDTATNVVIEDPLPTNTTLISAQAGGTLTGGTLQWTIGDVPAGSSASVGFSVRVDDPLPNGTVLHNTATISSAETGSVASQRVDTTVSSRPVLTIDQVADRSTANPGNQVTYTLTYANRGSDAATAVLIQDQLPSDSRFVSATGPYSETNGLVTWDLGNLPAGASNTVSVTVEVNRPLANGTVLHNTVNIDSTQTQPVQAGPADVIISSAPLLETITSVSRTTTSAGATLTYTVDYINRGTDQATGVLLESHLPSDTSFVSADGGGMHSGGVVQWNLGTLPAGAVHSVHFVVRVDSPIADGTVLHASSSIRGDRSLPNSSPAPDVVVSSEPVLVLTKRTGTNLVAAGSQLTYTLEVENTGTDTARNVLVGDTVPQDTTFVSATNNGMHDPSNGTVLWSLPDLTAGARAIVSLTVAVNSPLPDGTAIYNLAATGADNAPFTIDVAQVTVTSAPILSVTKSAGQSVVQAGQGVPFTLEIRNTGTDTAQGVTVIDQLPPGTRALNIGQQGRYSADTITWSLAALPAGQSVTLNYDLEPRVGTRNGTRLVNTVSATATSGATATATTSLRVDSAPDLTLVKRGGNSVEAGETVTYTLEYFNRGNEAASLVNIEDTYPPDMSFVSASNGGTDSGGKVSWLIGDVAPGDGDSVTVTLRADLGLAENTVLTNTATVQASGLGPVLASVDTVVRSHVELALGITAAPATVKPGDAVTFTIDLDNIGNATSSNTEVRASLPPNSAFSSATGGGSLDAGTGEVVWSLGALPPGPASALSFTVNVDSPLANGTQLTSVAHATDTLAPPASDQATVIVSSSAVLLFVKVTDATSAQIGDVVDYVLGTVNIGNAVATDVEITDTLPTGLAIQQVSAGGVTSGNQVTWTIGDLAPGDLALVGIETRVTSDFARQLDNRGRLTANGVDPVVVTVPLRILAISIPTLGPGGLGLLVLLLGLVGAVALRRLSQ